MVSAAVVPVASTCDTLTVDVANLMPEMSQGAVETLKLATVTLRSATTPTLATAPSATSAKSSW